MFSRISQGNPYRQYFAAVLIGVPAYIFNINTSEPTLFSPHSAALLSAALFLSIQELSVSANLAIAEKKSPLLFHRVTYALYLTLYLICIFFFYNILDQSNIAQIEHTLYAAFLLAFIFTFWSKSPQITQEKWIQHDFSDHHKPTFRVISLAMPWALIALISLLYALTATQTPTAILIICAGFIISPNYHKISYISAHWYKPRMLSALLLIMSSALYMISTTH